MAPKRRGRILPFRIPFFRIFYSTTYTTIYIGCLCLLAITPVSMIWAAIQNSAFQYIIMIGGTYVLTAVIAIFIYASRLYTNRTVLAGVGKPYIPVEKGEVGKKVRHMIVKQLEKSAIVAWESRPRDLIGEMLQAEAEGLLPPDMNRNEYTVGREIRVDPDHPPWGDMQHAGWSSPSQAEDNATPDVQFATIIAEMPNLIEAKAVSLAPADSTFTPENVPAMADPMVVEVLQRQGTMGMREYLQQLSYLGLINPSNVGQKFLMQYERARFSGTPLSELEFQHLMASFANLLSGMTKLDIAIIEQIRDQTGEKESSLDNEDIHPDLLRPQGRQMSSSSPETPVSSLISPVTARTGPSRSVTPYQAQDAESTESLGSVIHQTRNDRAHDDGGSIADSSSLESVGSDSASVIRHQPNSDRG